MAELEQTARRGFALEPTEQMEWLLPTLHPDLVFNGWLPTQAFAYPGDPDRRCDTVAELRCRSGRRRPWAVILEVEASPRRAKAVRAREYELRLESGLRHGPHQRDHYDTASVVVLLTGTRTHWRVRRRLPGTPLRTVWEGGLKCLANESAALTLAQIAAGRVGRSILIWIPLMQGGGEPTVVQRWAELARAEPDEIKRAEYGGLAQVFAERAGHLSVWTPILEGWEMWKSQVIDGWRKDGYNKGVNEGVLKTSQETLLSFLRLRYPEAPHSTIEALVQAQTDPNVLKTWTHAAFTATDWANLQALLMPK
jgi:hypothetical protein